MRVNKLIEKIASYKLQQDRAMLITCIGIAFVFWVLVKLSQSYPTVKPVVINIEMAEDKSLLAYPPTDIQAELKGTGWDLMLEHFYHSKIPVFISMLNSNSLYLNQNRMRTEIRNSLRFSAIEVLSVNYEEIQVELDNKASKKVPIQLDKDLAFSPGNQLRQAPTLTPDSVLITGPASILDSLDFWATTPLVLTDLKSSSTLDWPLVSPGPELLLDRSEVAINLELEQFTEKTLYIPVTITHAPEGDSLKVFPDKIQLTCQVGLSRYSEVLYQNFAIEADLQNVPLQEGKNTVPVRLVRFPLFVKGVKLERQSVEFFIVK
jgi:hypothetical protein